MKTIKIVKLVFLITLILSFACKKESSNPFDPDCPKEIWTPSGFTVEQSGNSLNLSWKQENTNISGFKIDRKVGSQDWSNVASPAKTATSWVDNDLTGGETHQYRLYAYAGENQSNMVTAQVTPVFAAIITTAAQTNLTCNSATLGGNVSGTGGTQVTERGIVYATTSYPTTAGTKLAMGSGSGSFTQNVTGLSQNTTYYVRAYAINSAGTSYGSQISFTTPACAALATVTTSTPTNISCTGATLGGNVTSDGGATVTERGVVYSTSPNPTTSNTKVTIGSGTGVFSKTVTGLATNTTYYVKSYAINSSGINYGDEKSFKTPSIATLTTFTATSITATSAILGGNITSDGGATITERGVVYATTTNPTTANTKITMGNGTGSFSQNVSGLTCGTTYYVRAYAINCAGTVYGPQISFPTSSCSPTINFTIQNPQISTVNWSRGLTVTLSCTISGTGLTLTPVSPFAGIYLSNDETFSIRTDQLIHEEKTTLSILSPSYAVSTKITIPSTVASGTYYIFFVADSKSEYDETNEKDNIEVIKVTVK